MRICLEVDHPRDAGGNGDAGTRAVADRGDFICLPHKRARREGPGADRAGARGLSTGRKQMPAMVRQGTIYRAPTGGDSKLDVRDWAFAKVTRYLGAWMRSAGTSTWETPRKENRSSTRYLGGCSEVCLTMWATASVTAAWKETPPASRPARFTRTSWPGWNILGGGVQVEPRTRSCQDAGTARSQRKCSRGAWMNASAEQPTGDSEQKKSERFLAAATPFGNDRRRAG